MDARCKRERGAGAGELWRGSGAARIRGVLEAQKKKRRVAPKSLLLLRRPGRMPGPAATRQSTDTYLRAGRAQGAPPEVRGTAETSDGPAVRGGRMPTTTFEGCALRKEAERSTGAVAEVRALSDLCRGVGRPGLRSRAQGGPAGSVCGPSDRGAPRSDTTNQLAAADYRATRTAHTRERAPGSPEHRTTSLARMRIGATPGWSWRMPGALAHQRALASGLSSSRSSQTGLFLSCFSWAYI